MASFFRELIRQCCLAFVLALLLASASCQQKSSPPPSAAPTQPQDHIVGTWRLNKDKAPVFLPHYNPIPVYELIVISRTGNRFTLTFSHDSAKPGESDRLLVGDMNMPNTPFVGVDALNGKLMVYYAYVRRADADSFVQGTGMSEENYKVLPDGKTLTVRQEPLIDNGFERKLVYDKVPDSPMTSFTRF